VNTRAVDRDCIFAGYGALLANIPGEAIVALMRRSLGV